ncbi:MAG TPA: PEP-CTERM sorting domain-containing protein [Planctomycetota bacterium]|nr:PEP-CTERM sorting domain-containing protein [Planctomycetota bacterium]
MGRFRASPALVCLALLAASGTLAIGAPIVTNSSFEADTFAEWPGYSQFGSPPDNGPITGWTTNRLTSTGINPVTSGNPLNPFLNGQAPPAGTKAAFIQGSQAGGRYLRQDVSGFVPGQVYRMRYYEAERGAGGPASPYVIVGGQTVVPEHRIRGNLGFRLRLSEPFVASSATLAIELGNGSVYASGDNTVLYDAVSFVEAPVTRLLSDGGFENPVQPGPNPLDLFKQAGGTGNGTLAGSLWTWTGAAGISQDGSAFEGPGQFAIVGCQHALIQRIGTFYQTLTGLQPGASYELTWYDAARNSQSQGNPYQVLVDSLTVFGGVSGYRPTNNAYEARFSDEFFATAPTAVVTFRGLGLGGPDVTSFFDDVRLTQLTVVPEPATFALLGLALAARRARRRRRPAA